PGSRRVLVHDPVLDPIDVQMLGGVAVTVPERTLIDLVRWPATVPERREWARLLVQADPALVARAASWFSRSSRGPGSGRVTRFLAEHGPTGNPPLRTT
ncbi:MAG: hypothetical protein JST33_01265, partial [Actinobacteria bacterium]|nr:hypothetical protein [Actinomycetota bacterium]